MACRPADRAGRRHGRGRRRRRRRRDERCRGAYAAAFYGPVVVGGPSRCRRPQERRGAASRRLASPAVLRGEPRELVRGLRRSGSGAVRPSIPLDPDFAAVVDTSISRLPDRIRRPHRPLGADRRLRGSASRERRSGGHVLVARDGEAEGHRRRHDSSRSRSRRNRRCPKCRLPSMPTCRQHPILRGPGGPWRRPSGRP